MAESSKRTGYRIDLKPPHDRDIKNRRWFIRAVFLLLVVVLLIAVPTVFFGWFGAFFADDTGEKIGVIIGLVIGGIVMERLVPSRMLIYNPEWTGYVTQNALNGKMVIYGPGLHASLPWESRNKKGNWSLKVITRAFSASIATLTSLVTVHGKYEYAMRLSLLDRAIGIDESTIDEGIVAFVKSSLTDDYARKKADAVLGEISHTNEVLASEFMRAKTDDPDTPHDEREIEKLSDQYGFTTVSIVIDGIELPKPVQKTRDSKDEAAQLFEVVCKMYGYEEEALREKIRNGQVTPEQYNTMLNRALAASENANMTINVVEGNPAGLLTAAAAPLASGSKS